MFDNEPYESNNEYLDESDDVLYISICMVICFCKCKLFPFFPRFVIVDIHCCSRKVHCQTFAKFNNSSSSAVFAISISSSVSFSDSMAEFSSCVLEIVQIYFVLWTLLTILASSADAERGFNRLKMAKRDWRSKLSDTNLSDQMTIEALIILAIVSILCHASAFK
jgi:hypothetical protein